MICNWSQHFCHINYFTRIFMYFQKCPCVCWFCCSLIVNLLSIFVFDETEASWFCHLPGCWYNLYLFGEYKIPIANSFFVFSYYTVSISSTDTIALVFYYFRLNQDTHICLPIVHVKNCFNVEYREFINCLTEIWMFLINILCLSLSFELALFLLKLKITIDLCNIV